jgi:hypothetical protein
MAGSSGGIRAGKAYVEIHGDSTPLMRAMKTLPKTIVSASAGIGLAGGVVGGLIAGGIASAFSAVTDFARTLGDTAGRLVDMADRTGVSVSALAELDFAATKGGTSLETLEGGLRKMSVNLADAAGGSKTAVAAFDAIGVSVSELSGLSPDQQFERIADGLAGIADPGKRAAAAMDIFGKSGADLLPLVKDGAKGVQAFREDAKRLGSISGETAGTLDRLGDVFDTVAFAVGNSASTIAATFGPQLESIGSTVISLAGWLSETAQAVQPIVAGFSNAAHELLNFGTAADIVKGIGITLQEQFGPLGETLVGVATYAGGEWMKLFDILGTGWQGFFDAIAAGDLATAFEVQVATLDVLWQQALATLGVDWVDWTATIESTFVEVSATLQSVWTETTAGLGKLWNDLVATISDLWDGFVGWFESTIITAQNMVGILSDEAAKAQKRAVEDRTDKKIGERSASTESANSRIEEQRAARRAEIERNRQSRNGAIWDDAKTNTSAKRLADAKAKQDALAGQAADNLAAAQAAQPLNPKKPGDEMRSVAIAGSAAMMATSAGAISFGGAAAGMAASQGPMNKLVSSNEQIAENTEKLVRKFTDDPFGVMG